MSYEPYVPPPGVNAGPSTAPGASNYVATGYITPGSIGNTGRRSEVEISFGHVMTGRDSHRYVAALGELGLTVRSPSDVMLMSLEELEVVVARADAEEASRVANIRTAREARLADMVAGDDGYTKARRAFAENVIPKCEAIAAAIRAEYGTDEDLADFLSAVDSAAAEGMPFSQGESFYRTQRAEAEKDAASPIPAEDFVNMRLCGVTRGWLPDAVAFVRCVLGERRKERAARAATTRALLAEIGVSL